MSWFIPLYPLGKNFYLDWMLNFIKFFSCIYYDDHLVFCLFVCFVDVYHIDFFVCVEPSLWPWNESNLIVVHDLFDVLLDLIYYYFVENFCIYIYQRYWPIIFFSGSVFVWFWYQGDGDLIGWLWECSLPFRLLEEFEKAI